MSQCARCGQGTSRTTYNGGEPRRVWLADTQVIGTYSGLPHLKPLVGMSPPNGMPTVERTLMRSACPFCWPSPLSGKSVVITHHNPHHDTEPCDSEYDMCPWCAGKGYLVVRRYGNVPTFRWTDVKPFFALSKNVQSVVVRNTGRFKAR